MKFRYKVIQQKFDAKVYVPTSYKVVTKTNVSFFEAFVRTIRYLLERDVKVCYLRSNKL